MPEERAFTVVIEEDEEGWLVGEVPELRGCYTQGKTLDELIVRIREVIQLCLEEQGSEELPRLKFVGVQRVTV